jgi:hypothetical protein
MLGDTYEHLDIDKQFLSWVKADKVLQETLLLLNGCKIAHSPMITRSMPLLEITCFLRQTNG